MSATYEVISPHVSYTSPIRAVTVNADSPTLQVYDTSTGTVSDIYWSSNPAGTDRVYSVNYGDDVYLIVKTLGYGTSASVTFATDKVTAGDLEYGTISGTINVPLTFNADTNSGFGYYRLRTWSEDDMGFKNLVPTNVSASRNYNTEYYNTDSFPMILEMSIMFGSGGSTPASYNLYVDGEVVGVILEGVVGSNNSGESSTLIYGSIGGSITWFIQPGSKYMIIGYNGTSGYFGGAVYPKLKVFECKRATT